MNERYEKGKYERAERGKKNKKEVKRIVGTSGKVVSRKGSEVRGSRNKSECRRTGEWEEAVLQERIFFVWKVVGKSGE